MHTIGLHIIIEIGGYAYKTTLNHDDDDGSFKTANKHATATNCNMSV